MAKISTFQRAVFTNLTTKKKNSCKQQLTLNQNNNKLNCIKLKLKIHTYIQASVQKSLVCPSVYFQANQIYIRIQNSITKTW